MFGTKRKQPEEIFTPRSANVNNAMYVSRGVLEERLKDALKGRQYIIIHGESGNGKTWLFKKVLAEENFYFTTLSLSNAQLYGSLSDAINDKLGALGYARDSGVETTTTGSIRPQNIGFERTSKVQEIIQAKGSFSNLVHWLRQSSNCERVALVLDNFEQIMDNEELLAQLRALIISADDDEIARNNVKVLIVGVPGNLKDLVAKTSGANPIVNRLVEIPEVDRIATVDAKGLLHKGLFKELKYQTYELEPDQICSAIAFLTDGIAQQIHEYALHIAQQAERNDQIIDQAVLSKATANWISSTLSADWAILDDAMNSRKTEVGRKNQVLYCIARAEKEEFKTAEIEAQLRREFDVSGVALNISQVLSGFASQSTPILKRTPKEDAWRFISPKHKIVLRLALGKDDDGRVANTSYAERMD